MDLSTPDSIFNELDRLGISTNQDSCSGLMSVEENSAPYAPDGDTIEVVKLYDDHADGFYNGPSLLKFLKKFAIGDITLSGDSPDNFWQLTKTSEAGYL